MSASPLIGGRFFDTRAVGLTPGAALYTYAAGTLTPLATYTDAGGGSPNTNPVILNGFGQADVFLGASSYRMRLYTDLIGSGGVLLWDEDNIVGASALSSSTGAAQIGFIQSGAGAAVRTLQDKGRESVTVNDFTGSDPTGATDSYAAIVAAITSLGGRGVVNLGPGTFKVSAQLVVPSGVTLRGAGFSELNGTGAGNRGATCILRAFVTALSTILFSGDDCGMDMIDVDNNFQGTGQCVEWWGSRADIGVISCRNSGTDNFRVGRTNAGASSTNTNCGVAKRIICCGATWSGARWDDTNTTVSASYPLGVSNANGWNVQALDLRSNGIDGLQCGNCDDNFFGIVVSQSNGRAVVFTAAPLAAATSATLTGNWPLPTGSYHVEFVNTATGAFEYRYVTLTNGATTATWTGGLSANSNATAGTGSGIHFKTDGTNSGPRTNLIQRNDSEANFGADILSDAATLPAAAPGLYNVIFGNRSVAVTSRIVDNSTGNFVMQWRQDLATGKRAYHFGETLNVVNVAASGVAEVSFYADTVTRNVARAYAQQVSAGGKWSLQTFGASLADRLIVDRDITACLTGLSGGVLFNKTVVDNTTSGVNIEGGAVGRIDIVNSGAGTKTVASFFDASGAAGSITTNGSGTAAYLTTSDERLKQDIVPMAPQGSVIDALKPRQFAFKADPSKTVFGFIAQELYEVYPDAVHVGGDDPKENPWGTDDSKLMAVMVKELQELRARVAGLEATRG